MSHVITVSTVTLTLTYHVPLPGLYWFVRAYLTFLTYFITLSILTYHVPCRIAAKQQMDEAGLTVQRFDAIDGRELSIEALKNVSTSLAMFLQPRGVLGCYLSHRAFWQVNEQEL